MSFARHCGVGCNDDSGSHATMPVYATAVGINRTGFIPLKPGHAPRL
ncbi:MULTISPECIES: hypothetical protein [unclassified Rickettsia]